MIFNQERASGVRVMGKDDRSALLIRTCRSVISVVAALALAGCAETSPEPVSGSALPSPEPAQQNAEAQLLDRIEGDYATSPKPIPPKPVKCVRITDWPANNERDDEFRMTDLLPDGTFYSFDCYTEDWGLGTEPLSTGVTGSGIWDNPKYDFIDCDPRPGGGADASIACSPMADGLKPDGSEAPAENKDQEKFELKIYEDEETGDVDMILPGDLGAVIEWSIPFPR